MASTFTTNGKLEKQGTGENSGSWGTGHLNTKVIDMVDEAVFGYTTVDLASASVTLTIPNGATGNGRMAAIKLTGNITGNNRVITMPAVSKVTVFRNATTQAVADTVTVKVSGGSNSITIPNGATRIIYSDGVEAYQINADQALIGTQSLFIPAAYMKPLTTSGAATTQVEVTPGKPEVAGYLFPKASAKYVQFDYVFPKQYNGGTVTIRFRWATSATDTDSVVWNCSAVAVSNDDTIVGTYGTAVAVIDAALGAAYDECRSDASSALTISGTPAAGDRIFFKVTRDIASGSDTVAEDAILTGIEISLTTDKGNDA